MFLVWKHLKADTAALSIAAIDVADRCFAPSQVPTDQRPGKGDRAASPAPHTRQIEPTEAGQLYFERCKRIVAEARLAHEQLGEMVAQPSVGTRFVFTGG